MRDEGTNFLCEIEPHKIEIVAHITKKVRTVFWFSLIPIHSKNESHKNANDEEKFAHTKTDIHNVYSLGLFA